MHHSIPFCFIVIFLSVEALLYSVLFDSMLSFQFCCIRSILLDSVCLLYFILLHSILFYNILHSILHNSIWLDFSSGIVLCFLLLFYSNLFYFTIVIDVFYSI